VLGATAFADRAAWSVAASRRFAAHTHAFGPLADELALVVDEQRAVYSPYKYVFARARFLAPHQLQETGGRVR
jgi:hypothetical protein